MCDHAPVWARSKFRRRWGERAGSVWGAAAAGGGESDPETLVGTRSLYSVASAVVSLGDSRGNLWEKEMRLVKLLQHCFGLIN